VPVHVVLHAARQPAGRRGFLAALRRPHPVCHVGRHVSGDKFVFCIVLVNNMSS